MTRIQAETAIRNSAGRFFTCVFIKADGSRREMVARYCEAEPVKEHRERSGVLTVFDDTIRQYRSIRPDRLIQIGIDGIREEVG
jgi:hypothetical protein